MCHRSESGGGSDSGQCFSSEDFGWSFSGEDEIGIGNRLFGGHVPGIERVYDGNQSETDDDHGRILGEVFEQDIEARAPAGDLGIGR